MLLPLMMNGPKVLLQPTDERGNGCAYASLQFNFARLPISWWPAFSRITSRKSHMHATDSPGDVTQTRDLTMAARHTTETINANWIESFWKLSYLHDSYSRSSWKNKIFMAKNKVEICTAPGQLIQARYWQQHLAVYTVRRLETKHPP